jgi:hypothetical protein
MNSATAKLNLSSLTADLLEQSKVKIDNTFSSAWKGLGFKTSYTKQISPNALAR